MLSSAKGKGERSASGRENVGSVVSNQLGTSGGNRGGYLGRDFRDWPFPPDTRGGRDGWPRTGGQVKQTEEGRKGGCPDGRRKGSRGSIERTGRVSGLVGASSRHRPRSRSVFNDATSSFFSSSSLVP